MQAQNGSSGLTNFNIKYKWHKCGGIYRVDKALISPPPNVTYPLHCAYKIKIPDEDDSALISFKKMSLSSCDKSYILIRYVCLNSSKIGRVSIDFFFFFFRGRSWRSPIIGKYCGNEIPENIITPSYEFMIEYFASGPNNDFELHIDPAKTACGGKVSGKRTEITTPG